MNQTNWLQGESQHYKHYKKHFFWIILIDFKLKKQTKQKNKCDIFCINVAFYADDW